MDERSTGIDGLWVVEVAGSPWLHLAPEQPWTGPRTLCSARGRTPDRPSEFHGRACVECVRTAKGDGHRAARMTLMSWVRLRLPHPADASPGWEAAQPLTA